VSASRRVVALAPPPLRLPDGRVLSFDRARIMGVLNVTPDSFSDGGRYATTDEVVARGLALVEAGADILDIGGESTRPGSLPVQAPEQIRRVVPAIEALARRTRVPISVDTTSAEVAAAAIDAGASMVNDISAFRFDDGMLEVLARARVPCVAMHTSGPPAEMQRRTSYADVVEEVVAHLRARVVAAFEAGVPRSQVVLDPGIGFGKTLAQNLELLHGIPRLVGTGHAVLIGTSRKSFLGELTGRGVEERLMGTAGSVAAAVVLGAHLVRVHDVAELRDVVRVADAIRRGVAPTT